MTIALFALFSAACARTGIERGRPDLDLDVTALDAAVVDVIDVGDGVTEVADGIDAPDIAEDPEVALDPVRELRCPDDEPVPLGCLDVAAGVEGESGLCNGLDDDCDTVVDEGCACTVGAVQSCFAGPPGRVDAGTCRRGTQRCQTGLDSEAEWGPCTGGIVPRPEQCDGADNDCDGCVDEHLECVPEGSCPTLGDPRTPTGRPFEPYSLSGSEFYPGEALSWRWQIEGGICDGFGTAEPSFTLTGSRAETAVFTPRLSGSYRVTLVVETPSGPFSCAWVIEVEGPGLRVEMCYPESTDRDLDLYLMRTSTPGDWYSFSGMTPSSPRRYRVNPDSCGWHNCEARIRGSSGRADWGYEPSPVDACNAGPQGDQWEALGFCGNPRLDIDNNLSEGTGLPENINLDRPLDGDAFRVMIQNWTGTLAHPVVNVYCAGRPIATFGAAPDELEGFTMTALLGDPGAMWRVADIEMHVDASADTVDCTVTGLHPPGEDTGYDVTFNDPRF